VTQLTGRYKKTEHYVARHEDIIKSASAAIQSRNQPLKRVVSLISQARRIKLGPVKALPPRRGRTRTAELEPKWFGWCDGGWRVLWRL